jgi:hypothetical protein
MENINHKDKMIINNENDHTFRCLAIIFIAGAAAERVAADPAEKCIAF